MNPLKAARLKAGFISRGDAAKALGFDLSLMGRWERGVHSPSLEALIKMADLYQVSLDELVGRARQTA